MKVAIASLASLMVVAGIASSASAALVPLTNASFETDGMYSGTVTGWTKAPAWGQVIVEPDGFVSPHVLPADGIQHVVLGPATSLVSDSTQLLTGSDVDALVTLNVAVGNRSGLSTAAANSQINILLDGASVASTTLAALPAVGEWVELSVTYSVQAGDVGKALGVSLANIGGGWWDDSRLHVDNVRMDLTAVPEPASMGLLGLCGLALARRRRMA